MISTKGNARALHFSPDPMGLTFFYTSRAGFRGNFHIIVQMRGPGLGPVLGISLFLYFRHPSISDEKNCHGGGNNTRPCRDCEERLDGV